MRRKNKKMAETFFNKIIKDYPDTSYAEKEKS